MVVIFLTSCESDQSTNCSCMVKEVKKRDWKVIKEVWIV